MDPGQLPSLEEFAAQNMLDAKCVENLRSQPEEVQQFVIGRGAAEGSNPSAMITARIAKCVADYSIPIADITSKVEDFILANGLDDNLANNLRSESTDCQLAVLSLGPARGTNTSAMVQGRISKFKKGRL